MSNPYYNPTGSPATGSALASAPMRAEDVAVSAGFDLLPTLSGNGNKVVVINAGGTAQSVKSLVGTANQVTITIGSDFTFSLPQDIHTSATPTFTGVIATNFQLGSGNILQWEAGANVYVQGSDAGGIAAVMPSGRTFTVNIAGSNVLTITGNGINGIIGATTPAAGTFSNIKLGAGNTLQWEAGGNVYVQGTDAAGIAAVMPSGRTFSVSIAGSNALNVTGTGVNGTALGATTPSTAAVTTLSASGAFGCNGSTAQTKAVSGGTLAGVIAALVANGILSS